MGNNLYKYFIIPPALALALLPRLPLEGRPASLPWNAEVRVADENIHYHAAGGPRHRTVYNGPRGAGYLLVRFFQVVISPQDGPNCRFEPVCSAYGKHALEKHGLILGLMLAGDRVIRCNPYNPPGKDPCPDTIYDTR